nr:unnamed protein product [Callosobruchus chinensis]
MAKKTKHLKLNSCESAQFRRKRKPSKESSSQTGGTVSSSVSRNTDELVRLLLDCVEQIPALTDQLAQNILGTEATEKKSEEITNIDFESCSENCMQNTNTKHVEIQNSVQASQEDKAVEARSRSVDTMKCALRLVEACCDKCTIDNVLQIPQEVKYEVRAATERLQKLLNDLTTEALEAITDCLRQAIASTPETTEPSRSALRNGIDGNNQHSPSTASNEKQKKALTDKDARNKKMSSITLPKETNENEEPTSDKRKDRGGLKVTISFLSATGVEVKEIGGTKSTEQSTKGRHDDEKSQSSSTHEQDSSKKSPKENNSKDKLKADKSRSEDKSESFLTSEENSPKKLLKKDKSKEKANKTKNEKRFKKDKSGKDGSKKESQVSMVFDREQNSSMTPKDSMPENRTDDEKLNQHQDSWIKQKSPTPSKESKSKLKDSERGKVKSDHNKIQPRPSNISSINSSRCCETTSKGCKLSHDTSKCKINENHLDEEYNRSHQYTVDHTYDKSRGNLDKPPSPSKSKAQIGNNKGGNVEKIAEIPPHMPSIDTESSSKTGIYDLSISGTVIVITDSANSKKQSGPVSYSRCSRSRSEESTPSHNKGLTGQEETSNGERTRYRTNIAPNQDSKYHQQDTHESRSEYYPSKSSKAVTDLARESRDPRASRGSDTLASGSSAQHDHKRKSLKKQDKESQSKNCRCYDKKSSRETPSGHSISSMASSTSISRDKCNKKQETKSNDSLYDQKSSSHSKTQENRDSASRICLCSSIASLNSTSCKECSKKKQKKDKSKDLRPSTSSNESFSSISLCNLTSCKKCSKNKQKKKESKDQNGSTSNNHSFSSLCKKCSKHKHKKRRSEEHSSGRAFGTSTCSCSKKAQSHQRGSRNSDSSICFCQVGSNGVNFRSDLIGAIEDFLRERSFRMFFGPSLDESAIAFYETSPLLPTAASNARNRLRNMFLDEEDLDST